jgi:streptomycin 6-kinase
LNPSIKLRADLPADFIKTIQTAFGEEGREMLARLPELIADVSARWGLTDVQPVPNLSYNFVAFAKQGKGDVILKIGVPHREFLSEMSALRLFNGDGACRLFEYDEGKGFLLLERLHPGTMLSEVDDDDKRTHIAVDVMQKIWRLVESVQEQTPALHKFIQLTDWFDELKNIRPHFDGGTGPFPKKVLEQVESFLPQALTDDVRLIHGDFHHFNILKSERGWLAIDPKGVIGPVGYEIGPLMINPWKGFSGWSSFQVNTKRRVDIIQERLGWEREMIVQWATAHAVLSAWWDYPNLDWEYSLNCAKIFSELK